MSTIVKKEIATSFRFCCHCGRSLPDISSVLRLRNAIAQSKQFGDVLALYWCKILDAPVFKVSRIQKALIRPKVAGVQVTNKHKTKDLLVTLNTLGTRVIPYMHKQKNQLITEDKLTFRCDCGRSFSGLKVFGIAKRYYD